LHPKQKGKNKNEKAFTCNVSSFRKQYAKMPTHYSLHKVTVTTQGWREPGLPKATKEQQSFSL